MVHGNGHRSAAAPAAYSALISDKNELIIYKRPAPRTNPIK